MVVDNNKRIAKNTLIVYAQLFVSMAVNLMASRFVLQALGASDFGLYNVVGGVIAMFTFISGSLATTTIRFLNYEMGKQDGNVNRIFNQSLLLHVLFACLILLLLESIGVFYILHYLNVDVGKEADAMFVFHVSTIVACVGVVFVPYQSLFTVHERFSYIALIDISSVLIKLALVVFLLSFTGNALRFYAITMGVVTLLPFLVYYILAKRWWPDIVKWSYVRDWRKYKEQLFYSNWNLLDTAAMVARAQGAALLINLFFGTVVNAAYAIANSVLQQVNTFVGKFDIAVAPQIMQNIGAGNSDRSLFLTSYTCRICFLLMEIVFFSLYVELDLILHLWLDEVPDGTLVFCQYTLMIALVSSTSSGLLQLINGLGRIKWFKIQKSVWYILALLSGYVFFKMGASASTVVLLFVISDVLCRITQLVLLKRMFSFDVLGFMREAYSRPIIVFVLMTAYLLCYQSLHFEHLSLRLGGIVLTAVVSLLLAVYVGLSKSERKSVQIFVLQRLSVNKQKEYEN